jgi:FdhD protein
VGAALLDGASLAETAMLSTGRISSEMVVKAARAEVPLAASRSAATSNAIDLAATHGVTLVGFARGDRMNVYTCGERVGRE